MFESERLEIITGLEQSHFWFVARRALVDRLFARHRRAPAALVVDVGCGTGSFAASLARTGARVIGLDLRPEGLGRLVAGGSGVWVAIAQSEHLPVTSGGADAAVALDVLEHADDTTSLLEIARVLKPGGFVLITVPALPWLWSARDEEAGHRRRYTRRTLVALIRRAGLEPVELHFYQCLLLPLVLVTRGLGRRWSSSQRLEERPAGWVNRLCLAVSRAEVRLGQYVPWPVGSSLAAVARKPV